MHLQQTKTFSHSADIQFNCKHLRTFYYVSLFVTLLCVMFWQRIRKSLRGIFFRDILTHLVRLTPKNFSFSLNRIRFSIFCSSLYFRFRCSCFAIRLYAFVFKWRHAQATQTFISVQFMLIIWRNVVFSFHNSSLNFSKGAVHKLRNEPCNHQTILVNSPSLKKNIFFSCCRSIQVETFELFSSLATE